MSSATTDGRSGESASEGGASPRSPRRIIVGMTGASGAIYGIRTLLHLRAMRDAGAPVETHLVMTEGAATTVAVETAMTPDDVRALADVVHRPDNLAASIASGSFRTGGMIVVPCSIKSLSGIAHSYADNLLVRAADVCLKERRTLVLVVREAPLHTGHLELMAKASSYGAVILPPMPAFYHRPETIEDLVDQTIGKAFDVLGIEHELFRRWGESRRARSAPPADPAPSRERVPPSRPVER